jgi:hypothetical protein
MSGQCTSHSVCTQDTKRLTRKDLLDLLEAVAAELEHRCHCTPTRKKEAISDLGPRLPR